MAVANRVVSLTLILRTDSLAKTSRSPLPLPTNGTFLREAGSEVRSFSLLEIDEPRTLEVERRARAAKLEVKRQAACKMATQVQTRLFPQRQPQTRTLVYAGICPPPALLLRGDDTVERLGPVVGLFDKWDCTMEERKLAPGDAVLLYTDGVTEALNGEGDEFGEERLLEAARQNFQPSLPELL